MPITRRIGKSGFLHICQKSVDNGILFYLLEDHLVFLTILSVKALAQGVIVVAIVLMFNHLHLGAFFHNVSNASRFMNGVTSVFARIYNRHYGLEGQLFKKPFKSTPKTNEKKIRDCLFYIWNNPVEKKAVKSAEEYRWNLLGYLGSDNPFSEPIKVEEASAKLVKLMRKVKVKRDAGEYLAYDFFDDNYYSLTKQERLQLIDYILVTYNFIDNHKILDLFGSLQSIVVAANAVTGNEYDITDDNDAEDYRHYRSLISITRSEGVDLGSIRFNRSFFEGKEELLGRLTKRFRTEAGASNYEILKFLHLL